MRTDFETSGDIRDVDLLAAFVGFWRGRASGAVSFSRVGASAAFGVSDGEIVSVSSSEARFESSAILVRAGKLDAAALDRLSIPQGSDGALAALQAGILTKREWRWGEKIRGIEVLADLLGWPDGKYYFDPEARPVAAESTLTVPRLLLELFLRSRDRNLIEHQLGASDAPLVRSADFESEFATFGLTADAESVVRLIDGRATADDIAQTAPAEDFAVRKLLAALSTLGLVRASELEAEGGRTEDQEPQGDTAAGSFALGPPRAVADWRIDASRERSDAGEMSTDDSATRAIPLPPASSSPGEAPVSEIRSRRESRGAFVFDPPGSTSSLEAYPLPGGALGEESAPIEEPRYGSRDFAPVPGPFDIPAETHLEAPQRRGIGPGGLLAGILAILVVGIAAVLFLRTRPVSSDRPSQPAPTPVAVAPTSVAPTSIAVFVPPPPSSVPIAAGVPAASATVRARPSPAPAKPAATARAVPPAADATPRRIALPRPTAVAAVPAHGASNEERGAPRSEWASMAAKDQKRLASDGAVRYAIQLELACEVPSLAEAWKHDRPAGSMWLLKTRHGSRDCFRVLWGRYPTLDAAKRAKGAIPAFFTTASNRPAVVSVR